jgi:hypothetical protein
VAEEQGHLFKFHYTGPLHSRGMTLAVAGGGITSAVGRGGITLAVGRGARTVAEEQGHFSKFHYTVPLHSRYTRALTFQNLCHTGEIWAILHPFFAAAACCFVLVKCDAYVGGTHL